jgi:hypothetical protein
MSSSSAPASEKEPAVFDASPLVFFDVLGYTRLLPELHRVLLPPAVVEELVALLVLDDKRARNYARRAGCS